MNIVVVEGEGAINNVRLRTANDLIVQVRDGNRRPIAGAKVTFTLPETGPSGRFPNGTRITEAATDDQGRAIARFKPDDVTGTMTIQVAAAHGDETATATVTQFNMYVPGSGGGAGKWAAIIGIVGAAAAGGVVAALRGRNGETARPAPTPIGITPGSGVVGTPR
jgi:hypothetical protein